MQINFGNRAKIGPLCATKWDMKRLLATLRDKSCETWDPIFLRSHFEYNSRLEGLLYAKQKRENR